MKVKQFNKPVTLTMNGEPIAWKDVTIVSHDGAHILLLHVPSAPRAWLLERTQQRSDDATVIVFEGDEAEPEDAALLCEEVLHHYTSSSVMLRS